MKSQIEAVSRLEKTIDQKISEIDECSSTNSKDFNGVIESKQSFKPLKRQKCGNKLMGIEDRIKCKPPQYGVPFHKSKDSVIDSLEFSQEENDNGK